MTATDPSPVQSPAAAAGAVRQFVAAPTDPATVRITAADYNGRSWGGSPFSAWAEWLGEAISSGVVRPVTPGSTDYAEFEVDTRHGCLLASPGDWLTLSPVSGYLTVLREASGPIHTPRKPLEAC